MIAVLAQMGENNVVEPGMDCLAGRARRLTVAKMTKASANARLHTRRVRSRAKHSLIMIRLDHHDVQLVERASDVLAHAAKVVNDAGTRSFADRCYDHRDRFVR